MTSLSVWIRARPAVIVLYAALLSGCGLSALGTQPTTKVYVLSSLADQEASAPTARPEPVATLRNVVVGVRTVGFPPYLERKEIVTRATDTRLVVHQFDKWGSPLEEDFARTLAADLRVLLPTRNAVAAPFRSEAPLDSEVRLTVDRFERLADGTVVLDARWVVLRQPEGRGHATRAAQIRIPSVAGEIPDVVAAMSEAVARLSQQVASDL